MLAGIVGKPNVGKSTFFSAITLIPVAIENRPFTTTKPNRGVGYVRTPCVCREFNIKDQPVNSICSDGTRLIPVELIDCAGLVPGAWQGRGLGNQFLDEIRKADVLIHIVDAAGATDEEGKMTKPGIKDPFEDVKFLEYEVSMWLTQIVKKDWNRTIQGITARRESLPDLLADRLSGLAIRKQHIIEALKKVGLNAEKPSSWSDEDLTKFVFEVRRIAKPMIIAANKIDLQPSEANIERLRKMGYVIVPCCAEAELVLRRAAEKRLIDYMPGDGNFNVLKPELMTEGQKRALKVIKETILEKWGSTGVQEVVNAAFFRLLQMIVVYPIEDIERLSDHHGRVLPDAYLVPYGTTARQLAYQIHTELGQSFIYAVEVRGKRRLGEEYMLKDGDVVKIYSGRGRA